MKIRRIRWVVGCFLLGILSKGYAVEWMFVEDHIVTEFVKSCISNPWLTWRNCADSLNQYLKTMGFGHRRSAEACRERWDRHLKNSGQGSSQLHKPREPGRCCWTEDKNDQLVTLVRRHTNGVQTNWENVSRDMGNRSATQCRTHYNELVSRGLLPIETPEDIPTHEEFEPTYEGFENPFGVSPFGDY